MLCYRHNSVPIKKKNLWADCTTRGWEQENRRAKRVKLTAACKMKLHVL